MEGKEKIEMVMVTNNVEKYEKIVVSKIEAVKNQAKEPEKAEEEMNYPKCLVLPEGLSYEEAKEKQGQILAFMLRDVEEEFEKRSNNDGASSSEKGGESSSSKEGLKDRDAEA